MAVPVQGLEQIMALLQDGGQGGNIVPNVEVTDEVRERFQVQDGRDQGNNTEFTRAPSNTNAPLTPDQSQMIRENIGDTGQRMASVQRDPINPGVIAANQDDLAEFEGTKIEGQTAKGVPEPEEISDIGKAFRNAADIMTTPGARQFLGRMGIAFGEGRENEPGVILGRAGLEDVQAGAEQKLVEGMLAGKSPSEIDLGGAQPSQETLRSARETALSEQQFGEEQEQFDEEVRLQERGQDMDFALSSRELDLMERELGLQESELDLERLQAVGDLMGENRPDDVSSANWGLANKMAASTFLDAARQTFRDEQNELADVQEIMNALSTENVGIDPTKIRSRLPDNMKQEYDDYVTNVAKSITRSSGQAGTAGGLDVPTSMMGAVQAGMVSPQALEASGEFQTIPATAEGRARRDQMDDGALFKVEGKPGFFIKQGNGQRRLGGSQ